MNGSISVGNELVAPRLQLRNLFFHERRKRCLASRSLEITRRMVFFPPPFFADVSKIAFFASHLTIEKTVETNRDNSSPSPLFARINFRDGGKVKRMDCRLALFSWKKSSRSERNGSSALSSLGIPRVRRRERGKVFPRRGHIYIYTWTRAELHASCNSARPVVFYADLNHILEE